MYYGLQKSLLNLAQNLHKLLGIYKKIKKLMHKQNHVKYSNVYPFP
jgi:hypothetical protein